MYYFDKVTCMRYFEKTVLLSKLKYSVPILKSSDLIIMFHVVSVKNLHGTYP